MKTKTQTLTSALPRKMLIAGLLCAGAIGLAPHANAESVRLKGETSGSRELQSATVTKLMGLFTPATKCSAPSLIEPKIVALQPRVDKNKQPIGLGKVKENWKITGCDVSRTYEVVYTFDDKKGTHIDATPLKGK